MGCDGSWRRRRPPSHRAPGPPGSDRTMTLGGSPPVGAATIPGRRGARSSCSSRCAGHRSSTRATRSGCRRSPSRASVCAIRSGSATGRRIPVGTGAARRCSGRASVNGGFTGPEVEPWLPMGDAARCNVADQREDPGSVLHLCRDLIALRRARADLRQGSLSVDLLLSGPLGLGSGRRDRRSGEPHR